MLLRYPEFIVTLFLLFQISKGAKAQKNEGERGRGGEGEKR